MQNNKNHEENIKSFVKLLIKTSKEMGISPIDLFYKGAEKAGVKIPKYKPVVYVVKKDFKNIKKDSEVTFDLNNTELENNKCYLLNIKVLDMEAEILGFYKEKEKGFIITNDDFLLTDEKVDIKVLGKLMFASKDL